MLGGWHPLPIYPSIYLSNCLTIYLSMYAYGTCINTGPYHHILIHIFVAVCVWPLNHVYLYINVQTTPEALYLHLIQGTKLQSRKPSRYCLGLLHGPCQAWVDSMFEVSAGFGLQRQEWARCARSDQTRIFYGASAAFSHWQAAARIRYRCLRPM